MFHCVYSPKHDEASVSVGPCTLYSTTDPLAPRCTLLIKYINTKGKARTTRSEVLCNTLAGALYGGGNAGATG